MVAWCHRDTRLDHASDGLGGVTCRATAQRCILLIQYCCCNVSISDVSAIVNFVVKYLQGIGSQVDYIALDHASESESGA